MKLYKVSALAAVSILAFAACSSSWRVDCAEHGCQRGPADSAAPERAGRWSRIRSAPSRSRPASRSTSPTGASCPGPMRPWVRTPSRASRSPSTTWAQFKGHDIQLTTEDGLCTPEGGATAATKLAADSTLVGLIGSACSDEVVGGIKTITEAGLTTISPSNTRPALTAEDRDATYAGYARTAHNDAFQGKVAAEYVYNEMGLKKAATIHDGSGYAEALAGVFATEFKALGGKIVAAEAIAKGTTDMSTTLKTMAAGCARSSSTCRCSSPRPASCKSQIPSTYAALRTSRPWARTATTPTDFLKAAGNAAVGHLPDQPELLGVHRRLRRLPREAQGQVRRRSAERVPCPGLRRHEHAVRGARQGRRGERRRLPHRPEGRPPRRHLRDQGLRGPDRHPELHPHGDCGAPVIAVYEITQADVDAGKMPSKPIWP